ncbi:MAG: hypothetical protein JXR97_12995 [Planctomycetes bacterium]|nr:hypothetical protein [Planctomycetota bacterium]
MLRCFMFLCLSIIAVVMAGCSEYTREVSINADGSCSVRTEILQDRKQFEQQLIWWKGYRAGEAVQETPVQQVVVEEEDEFEDAAPAKEKEKTIASAKAAMSEDELKKIAADFVVNGFSFKTDKENGIVITLDSIAFEGDMVRVCATRSYKTVDSMVNDSERVLGESGLDRIRIYENENGTTSYVFYWGADIRRQPSTLAEKLRLGGAKVSVKLNLPGKVVSSNLPLIEGNSASIIVEGAKGADEKLIELACRKIRVDTEKVELKAELPIDSREYKLAAHRAANHDKYGLQLTRAGEGFVVEPVDVKVPEYAFSQKERAAMARIVTTSSRAYEENAARIETRIFVPEDRRLFTLSDWRIIRAVDDKVRLVEEPDDDFFGGYSNTFNSADEDTRKSTFTLRMELPEADAKSISMLEGSVVAVTRGPWKRINVGEAAANGNKEISLEEILPGAKMKITSVESTGQDDAERSKSASVNIIVTGPAEINRLTFDISVEGAYSTSSYNYMDGTNEEDGHYVRNLTVSYHSWKKREKTFGKPVLDVLYPSDLKREEVFFTLRNCDLY